MEQGQLYLTDPENQSGMERLSYLSIKIKTKFLAQFEVLAF